MLLTLLHAVMSLFRCVVRIVIALSSHIDDSNSVIFGVTSVRTLTVYHLASSGSSRQENLGGTAPWWANAPPPSSTLWIEAQRAKRRLSVCQIDANLAKFWENSYCISRSFKVFDLGASQKCIYNFLLVINSNYGHTSYHFWYIEA